MKRSDIAMVILIASVSVMISFFVAKSIFGDVYSGSANVKTIEKIDSAIIEPSTDIFNKQAINPAVQVEIDSTGTTTNSTNQES